MCDAQCAPEMCDVGLRVCVWDDHAHDSPLFQRHSIQLFTLVFIRLEAMIGDRLHCHACDEMCKCIRPVSYSTPDL